MLSDAEMARRIYNIFVDRFLWIGKPEGSIPTLDQIRRQSNQNQLSIYAFHRSIKELQQFL